MSTACSENRGDVQHNEQGGVLEAFAQRTQAFQVLDARAQGRARLSRQPRACVAWTVVEAPCGR